MPKFVRSFGNMPAGDYENMVHGILSGIDLISQSIKELHPSNDQYVVNMQNLIPALDISSETTFCKSDI